MIVRRRNNGSDMPTMGMTGSEVIERWMSPKEIDIRACFTGQVVGFSVHRPSVEYFFGPGSGGSPVLKKSWRTSGGVSVCEDASDDEFDVIEKDIEDGAFQISYSSPSGVDLSHARYVAKRKSVILHQADGLPLRVHRGDV